MMLYFQPPDLYVKTATTFFKKLSSIYNIKKRKTDGTNFLTEVKC